MLIHHDRRVSTETTVHQVVGLEIFTFNLMDIEGAIKDLNFTISRENGMRELPANFQKL